MISHTRFIEHVAYPNIVIFFFCFRISLIVRIFFQKIVILVVDVILIVKVVVIHVLVVLLSGMVAILVMFITLLLCLSRRPDCKPVDAEDDEDDKDNGDGRTLP